MLKRHDPNSAWRSSFALVGLISGSGQVHPATRNFIYRSRRPHKDIPARPLPPPGKVILIMLHSTRHTSFKHSLDEKTLVTAIVASIFGALEGLG